MHQREQQHESRQNKGWEQASEWLYTAHKLNYNLFPTFTKSQFQLSTQNIFNHLWSSLKAVQNNDKVINKLCIKKKRTNKISCFSKEKWLSLEEKAANSRKIKCLLGKKSVQLVSVLKVIVHSRNHTI